MAVGGGESLVLIALGPPFVDTVIGLGDLADVSVMPRGI